MRGLFRHPSYTALPAPFLMLLANFTPARLITTTLITTCITAATRFYLIIIKANEATSAVCVTILLRRPTLPSPPASRFLFILPENRFADFFYSGFLFLPLNCLPYCKKASRLRSISCYRHSPTKLTNLNNIYLVSFTGPHNTLTVLPPKHHALLSYDQ